MYERIAYHKTSNRSYRFWRPARDAVMKTLMTRSISRPLHADNEGIELLMGEVGLCLTHVPEEVAADVAMGTTASIYIYTHYCAVRPARECGVLRVVPSVFHFPVTVTVTNESRATTGTCHLSRESR